MNWEPSLEAIQILLHKLSIYTLYPIRAWDKRASKIKSGNLVCPFVYSALFPMRHFSQVGLSDLWHVHKLNPIVAAVTIFPKQLWEKRREFSSTVSCYVSKFLSFLWCCCCHWNYCDFLPITHNFPPVLLSKSAQSEEVLYGNPGQTKIQYP